ncbi:MAG TPA: transcription-repair coupling factor [Acidimicrobiales bacterium]|nr:transcription-repair coupling factor [Acidimicrobiales bacterium]
MTLRDLPPLLRHHPALPALVGSGTAVLAVPDPARAFTIAGLTHLSGRHPIVVAMPTTGDAERLAHDLRAFLEPDAVDLLPAWETLPFERVSPGVETMGRRLRALWRLRDPSRAPRVLVAPVRALLQRLGPHVEDVEPVVVGKGDVVDPMALVERLVAAGYRREYVVEHRGEVARRGSIVDVFPSTADAPVRIDLWGDEVDRLTEFSVTDQRATDPLDCAEIFPCREVLPTDEVRARAADLVRAEPWGRDQWERLAEGLTFDGMESWLPWLVDEEHTIVDLLGPDAQVLLVEPRRMRDRAGELADEEAALAATLAQTWGASAERRFPRLHLGFDRLLAHTSAPVWTLVPAADSPDTPAVQATGWDPVLGDPERLGRQVADLVQRSFTVVVAADGKGSAARLAGLLAEQGISLPVVEDGQAPPTRPRDGAGTGWVEVQPLERGFVLPDLRLAVLVESDVTGRRRPHRRPRPRRTDAQAFFDDLQPGDYVVHHQHGVARYGGMVKRAIGGADRDYLLLEYRGGDKLYVPSDQIDAVRHYTGGDTPAVSRLGGAEWQRTKARVKAAVREIAEELVALYRARIATPGHAFPPDTPWQRELEEAFPYTLTPDQAKAIADVKTDMERGTPMDRLVCGDVGFGKTEVAVRAAFKTAQDGKQTAVLVPTTLLAQQHFQTFSERFAGYPVRVEVLSRFLTPAQAKRVVDGLADGSVDVVIGTHRLLSADVRFRDLGLLVVDEEQRFGVTHKEAIKRLRTNVDVLTLTATPIPRTLEMSLTGIRDLTILNTAPPERQPILTYVGEYDERPVGEAVRRELLREGQVFFVHNRVADIDRVAARLKELVPEARIAVAHGQMDEGQLERVVLDFWEGDYDVLVCTTIIESGIDMPTVNTLVVDRADAMGLGQLHQLRGRVGRAGQRAYAYLFFPPERKLTEEAYERLKTIGEHTELGSGFKIAMRDLEIRGAGNLLGATQSGHIAAVGYDLYVQMVAEAVAEVKGEELRPPAEIKLDLPVDANLPSDYVAREEQRLEAYRRLAVVTTEAEVDDIAAEWHDRYGPPPPPAQALLRVARLRAECARTGVREVTVARDTIRIAPLELRTSQRIRLQRISRDAVYKEDLSQLVVPLRRGADALEAVTVLLGELVPAEAAASVASAAR